MKEYKIEVSKDNLMTAKDSMTAFAACVHEIFRELGYEMTIDFKDDKKRGVRVVRARWEEKEKNSED